MTDVDTRLYAAHCAYALRQFAELLGASDELAGAELCDEVADLLDKVAVGL